MPQLFLLADYTTTAFSEMVKPIIQLVNSAVGPLLAFVVAIGTVYCIFVGVKIAKAEEPQEREKSKQQLKNAIIGFLLIFILIAALNVGLSPLEKWMDNATGMSTATTMDSSSN